MSFEDRNDLILHPGGVVGGPSGAQSKTEFPNANAFDGGIVLRMLGTFWSRFFDDTVTLRGLYDGTGLAHYQAYLNFLEAIAALSKFQIPVFHTKNWYVLSMLESEQGVTSTRNFEYGTPGLTYENVLVPQYGDRGVDDDNSFPVPEDLVASSAIYNRILDPSLVFMSDRDYVIDVKRNLIRFTDNPFENELIATRDVLDEDGNVIDREAVLWLYLSEWDHELVYNQFGYVLGIWMQSSTFYKDFISALWDSMIAGSSRASLDAALVALTGVELARDVETVLFIRDDGGNLNIITDKNLYVYKLGSTPLVVEGENVVPGQPLIDAVLLVEPTPDEAFRQFTALALGKSFLSGKFTAPLVFENKLVNVRHLGADTEGRVIVEFDVGGLPQDLDRFWRDTHLKGVERGKTLAELLDTRVNTVGQPKPEDLPPFINPFKFVMDNLLANNAYVLLLKEEDFTDGAPGLGGLVHLKRFLPPHTTFIIFIEIDMGIEYYDLGGTTEEVGFLDALSITESFSGVFDKGARINVVKETCI